MLKALLASVAARAFMSDVVETVLITTPGGDVRVNRSDYEADQAEGGAKSMKLASAKKQEGAAQSTGGVELPPLPENVSVPPAPAAPFQAPAEPAEPIPPQPEASNGVAVPTTPAPGQLLVAKEGTKAKPVWFVVRMNGGKAEHVTDLDGINQDGYAVEQDAWAAIVAATPH